MRSNGARDTVVGLAVLAALVGLAVWKGPDLWAYAREKLFAPDPVRDYSRAVQEETMLEVESSFRKVMGGSDPDHDAKLEKAREKRKKLEGPALKEVQERRRELE